MSAIPDVIDTFRQCLTASDRHAEPYRHWLLKDVLPVETARAVRGLPFEPAEIEETNGRRETNNQSRIFFSEEKRSRFAVCDALATALQDRRATGAIEETCGITLEGTNLRIEYCQDTAGFWLEPHTDIAEKAYTMLIYLSDEPGSEAWGTDIYDSDLKYVGSAPYAFNRGLIFIPGQDTWHGFRRRPINGVRRSLIVNYVKSSWRARQELAFPNNPIGQGRHVSHTRRQEKARS